MLGISLASADPTYTYSCPTGASVHRNGVCVATLQDLTESLTEPDLAIDPANPNVMVIGTNASQNIFAFDPERQADGVRTQLLGVHVSEDGGSTWARRRIPMVPFGTSVESTSQWDPSFAFGTDGTLHASGIQFHGATSLSGPVGIFYTSSSDRGRTWTEPVILGAGDRQWLSVMPDGHVFVAWWTNASLPYNAQVAMSTDNGRTWTTQGFDDCAFPWKVVASHGAYFTACVAVTDAGAPVGTRVLSVDGQTGSLSEVAYLSPLYGLPAMLQPLADGSLLMLVPEGNCSYGASRLFATRSSDGATWSTPVDLFAQTLLDESMMRPRPYGVSADPWGTVQVLVSGPRSRPGQPGAPESDYACIAWLLPTGYSDEIATAHMVLDPVSLTVVHSKALSPALIVGENRVPPAGYGLSRTGDFYGLAARANDVMLVWEYERGLDYTFLTRQ